MHSSTMHVPVLPEAPGPHTWKDFLALPDDDKRELIDGHFIEIDVPNEIHEWIVANLVTLLMSWARAHRAGIVFASGYKVRINERRGVMPDVQFFRTGHPRIGHEGLEEGSPDLAVEVISPSSGRFDRVKKREWYESIGTPEYWLFDPVPNLLERWVSKEGRFTEAERFEGDVLFRPDTFPGLEVQLRELWKFPDWSGWPRGSR